MNHRFGDMNRFATVNMAVILRDVNKVFWVETNKYFPDRQAWGGSNGLEPCHFVA
jgi:hypothetical protein